MVKASDLMIDPEFVQHDDPVEEVVEEFMGAENTLLVRKDGEVIGEIHEDSVLKAVVPEERLDEERVTGILGISFDSGFVPETAEDLMNEHAVSIDEEETLGEIAFLMFREDIRSIPVTENGEVKGVVHEERVIKEGDVE